MSSVSRLSVSRLQPLPLDAERRPAPVYQVAPDWQFALPDSWAYRILKRLIDVAFSLCGLALLLPLLPVVVLLIRLDSPGPVIFAQRRVGQRGRQFTCYKFRSMVAGAEAMKSTLAELNEASGPAFKIRDDPRITRVGAFLRRSSLDEVPQLLNVLRGQMSIVGPRPQIPTEVELYEPWHRRRLEVKPGITCLWQIAGRSHIGFDEWMRLDLEYLRRRSLQLDLWIVLHTLPAVIARKGAY
ncbi:MAG TPA: exopolysaccharide biosynthesis polyprenyl glycosylphosphotransferase [Candidatus Krumholzibacteria bacterium]|nr:exopolysaccharide biosynthesis polyprenyl glycosylphosphotransferase [Candidatus Krumholzibacteria bacterium]